MENKLYMEPIGSVNAVNGIFCIQLTKEFIPALTNFAGFSHLQATWWYPSQMLATNINQW